jgi:hypothetical protein
MPSATSTTLLDRLRRAREARAEHEQAFAETVRAAMADRQGHPVSEIAQAAGITRVRAYQIAAGRR